MTNGLIGSESGRIAERKAEVFLKKNKFDLVERNFFCKGGEIDLIAKQKNTLAFIEVRFRKTDSFGSALASVTKSKQKKITIAASVFLQNHPQFSHYHCRFDVIAITGEKLTWIENAFYPQH